MCRLYGRIVNLEGCPTAFEVIEFRAAVLPGNTVLADGVVVSPSKTQAVTNRDGYFQIDLPRSADILLRLPHERQLRGLTVPDLECALLFGHVFPHPNLLKWVGLDPDDDTVIDDLVYTSPNTIAAPVGVDVYLGIAACFSDGSRCAFTNPIVELGGPDASTTDFEVIFGTALIRLQRSSAGTVTLTSLEQESLSDTQKLWERAGYVSSFERFPPYFFPPNAHELCDVDDLTIVFS